MSQRDREVVKSPRSESFNYPFQYSRSIFGRNVRIETWICTIGNYEIIAISRVSTTKCPNHPKAFERLTLGNQSCRESVSRSANRFPEIGSLFRRASAAPQPLEAEAPEDSGSKWRPTKVAPRNTVIVYKSQDPYGTGRSPLHYPVKFEVGHTRRAYV